MSSQILAINAIEGLIKIRFGILGSFLLITGLLSPAYSLADSVQAIPIQQENIAELQRGKAIFERYTYDHAHYFIKDYQDSTLNMNKEYYVFLKNILLGEFLDLTGNNSEYAPSKKDRDALIRYVVDEIQPAYQNYPKEADIAKVPDKSSSLISSKSVLSVAGYNRQMAIDYATAWWDARNPAYPDFGDVDCTNFISQSIEAGGFSQHGTGACRDESTITEWYAESNSPPLTCWGSNRNWVWSSSWSVVLDFRIYVSTTLGAANVLGWTIDPVIAKNQLEPGDIVQLQEKQGNNWISFHNMIVTGEDNSDLLMTYHATNRLNKPLSQIPAGANQRYVLVKML